MRGSPNSGEETRAPSAGEGLTLFDTEARPAERMKPSSLLRQSLEAFERAFLQSALTRHAWNRTQTARELGVSYRGLAYKIERFHLAPPRSEFSEPA
jgi:DNA-binding NtrC family response regulator